MPRARGVGFGASPPLRSDADTDGIYGLAVLTQVMLAVLGVFLVSGMRGRRRELRR